MKLFIIGINGISMQGIAHVMKNNHDVYGWDDDNQTDLNIKYTKVIDNDTDLVIYSSAIKKEHPLIKQANEKKIPIINRTDFFLKYMPLNEEVILIAGAHGKTTTSSILSFLLGSKSYYLGGILNNTGLSCNYIKDKFTVIETDESDGSFIKWKGKYKVLLNFDYEHMTFFKTKENIKKYHINFVMDNIENTKVIINNEAKDYLQIQDHPNIITFGKANADYVYSDLTFEENSLSFKINNENINIPMLGEYNAFNFTAAYALLNELKLPFNEIKNFPGVKKRMQKIYTKNNYDLYLDYAHHPAEVEAVLKSFYMHKKKKPNIIFEGHKPSRILYNLNLWPKAFQGHKVFLYPIHYADEKNTYTTEEFAEYLRNNNIDVEIINDINNYKINNHTLCLSAGKLSSVLQALN